MNTFNRLVSTALMLALFTGLSWAQEISQENVIPAMRDGGFVILMRHASSPRQAPGADVLNSDNATGERQLDENGRRTAQAMGEALQGLGIQIEEVASSPTYRALETARHMGFEEVDSYPELGTDGMRESAEAYADWLKQKLSMPLETGNLLVISHAPILSNAFPEEGRDMEDGEALIFQIRDVEEPVYITKIKIHEWSGF